MAAPVVGFASYHAKFSTVTGPHPQITLCLEEPLLPIYHEAGVFVQSTGEYFVTSNLYPDETGKLTMVFSKIKVTDGSYACERVHTEMSVGNGGVNYKDGILWCDYGSLTKVGGLIYMSTTPPYQTEPVVETFNGVPFNSVNDVVVAEDGAIWWTDPIYGYEQGLRPPPQLPAQVYRYDPNTKSVRAMADGFDRPNGICFSPDEKVVYVTDTGIVHHGHSVDPSRASNIYAFDVAITAGEPFLINRRLFAFADGRAPDGIKCDMEGNVYSGCRDGISICSPGGVLLGKILIEGGCCNFSFCRAGEIMAMNQTRLWRIQLAETTIGALLRIGSK
ncbi:MAG: SMP-30 Gluconolaconase LRE-like region [Lasallia pustulata]|uniref:SMP-30 Gluconolaconase LRE-like region n=1 Tax=Lasallia pustulata TaxID=136370 RepID=A0A5M8PHW5_9LECA|nr:MAG: SMP-30 Gluconolaconase LRE-like region [Lasallia pustulata]